MTSKYRYYLGNFKRDTKKLIKLIREDITDTSLNCQIFSNDEAYNKEDFENITAVFLTDFEGVSEEEDYRG